MEPKQIADLIEKYPWWVIACLAVAAVAAVVWREVERTRAHHRQLITRWLEGAIRAAEDEDIRSWIQIAHAIDPEGVSSGESPRDDTTRPGASSSADDDDSTSADPPSSAALSDSGGAGGIRIDASRVVCSGDRDE